MNASVNAMQRRLRARLATLWPRASLRAYLAAIMLIATLPVIAFMAYKIYLDIGAERARMWRDLERTAAATAQSVDRELAESIEALSLLGRTTLASNADSHEFEQLLHQRPPRPPSWRGMFLIASSGDVLVNVTFPIDATPPAPLDNVSDRPNFQSMLAQPRPMVSNLLKRSRDGAYTTAVAVPVIEKGRLRYVVGAWIDVTSWQQLIVGSGPPSEGYLSLFDRDHVLIARTQSPERYVGSPLTAEQIAAIGDRYSGTHRTTMREGGEQYGAWQLVPRAGWGVSVNIPAAPLDLAIYQSVATAAAGALLCVMLGLYFASIVARHLVLPLDQLSKGVTDVSTPVVVRDVADLRQALAAAQDRDVAARKRLQTTADEFETLFNSSPVALAFAHDRECRVVTNNSAMDSLFGIEPGREPLPVQVLHDGQPLPPAAQPLQRAASGGEQVPPLELQVVVQGRTPRYVLAQAVPLRDAAGSPRGAIGAVVDITEQVRSDEQLLSADRRLRETQNLIELAQEAGHVGFFQYRFADDALNWSPGQARLFGIEPRSMQSTLGEWVRHINVEDRMRVEHALRSMFAAGKERETLEYRVTPPQGETRWLSSRVLVIYDGDHQPQQLTGVSVDVTDEKQAQRERAALIELERSARRQAEAASQAKDEFLAMLGHELRNPLSAIASAVEVLNRVESGSELATNARAIAARQTRHLAHMMDDLLDVGRVISGKVLLSRRAVDLAMIAQRVMATLEVTGEAQRHVVQLQLEGVWVDADATRVEQVMGNLVTNALKYTPAGGRITVRVGRDVDHAVLEVSDNGPGIPPTLLPRIFDLFVQGERTLDRRTGGLGIGLTLARRLVELHGGTIDAQSSPRGSTFTVRLPSIEAPAMGEAA
ncbi:MAG TPA: ATP-binding protein, partial [Burkholderiaceae bacterium]|nr:ATP-binding protein [Burkholderiaceae bacterium]